MGNPVRTVPVWRTTVCVTTTTAGLLMLLAGMKAFFLIRQNIMQLNGESCNGAVFLILITDVQDMFL